MLLEKLSEYLPRVALVTMLVATLACTIFSATSIHETL